VGISFLNYSLLFKIVKRSVMSHLEVVSGNIIPTLTQTVVGINSVIVLCLSYPVLIQSQLVIKLTF
jgi:hypothetical protein